MANPLPQKLEEYERLPDPTTKAELLARMTATYESAESQIAAHPETALSQPLPGSDWSFKDHLAHLTAWERGMVALLQKQDRFATMGIDEGQTDISDHDAVNAALYELNKDRPISDILADFRRTRRELLDVLAPLTDQDLQKPYRHYQPQAEGRYAGKPVMGWLAGNTYAHYAEHLLEIGRLLNSGG